MKTKLLLLSIGAGLTLVGCAEPKLDEPAGGTDTDGESATSFGPGPEEPGETDPGDTDNDTFSVFLPPDGGSVAFECDVWTQDCPDGHKCMPWDNTGTGSWNATRCSALDPNPAQIGDVCAVEGTGVSGVDNCALGSMCWGVDPETNTGTCIAFCSGTDANPSCSDPSTTCSITNDGALILCLPSCDPLEQACREGEACYGVGSTFICAPNAAPADGGSYGSPCAYLNVCNPGLFCAGAAGVPGCQGAEGCCSEFCDLSSPDGDAQCQGAAGGQACVPWFEDNQAPPGLADVGACFVPA
jgi:hypothetical protein